MGAPSSTQPVTIPFTPHRATSSLPQHWYWPSLTQIKEASPNKPPLPPEVEEVGTISYPPPPIVEVEKEAERCEVLLSRIQRIWEERFSPKGREPMLSPTLSTSADLD